MSPVLLRAIALWRPYRAWHDLLLVSDIDDVAIATLQREGFEIIPAADSGWAAPNPFKLYAGAALSAASSQPRMIVQNGRPDRRRGWS